MAAANGLIDAAEATRNPYALSFALLAYGFAFRDADPDRALDALRRGLVIAQDSGNRYNEITPGGQSCAASRPNTATRWPRSITSLWRSATTTTRATPPISVSRWLSSPPFSTGSDATNRRPPSPVSPFSPLTAAWVPEINTAIAHLRDVLGDQTYESLARKGETMTTAAMATYALRPNRPGPSRTERRLEIDDVTSVSIVGLPF